jgi:ABC-2 type transport system permease protein
VVSNSFLNTSSSIFMMKLQGTIVDLLVAPLSYLELLTAFIGAAIVRGLLVGSAMWFVAALFTGFDVAHPLWALAFVVLVASFFGGAGMLVAIWADKFEQVNLVPTFVVTPLTFLGGVFYSVDRLPSPFREAALANPVLYMVEGLRYAMLGRSDVGPWAGFAMLVGINVVVLGVAYRWLKSGYKLRS